MARSAALQGILDTVVRRNHGHGGGVIRLESLDRGLLWEGASGWAKDREPMDVGDSFEIASVTKTFTATLVLKLVEEGRFALDDRVGGLLAAEEVRSLLVVRGHDYGPEITVRQLLKHMSGLPDYWVDPPLRDDANAFLRSFLADPNRDWHPPELLAYARQLRPIGAPGERYHYCDTGYVLLGLILERTTGKTLYALLRERIFGPLGMRDTYFSYRELAPPGLRESHRYEDTLDIYGQRRQTAEWAGGGLVTSTRDLGRFVLALARGQVFRSEATLHIMQDWVFTGKQDVKYGLGLFQLTLDDGLGQLWGHDGHGNAFMFYWPEQRIALVGTLNQTENDWWDLVAPVLRELCAQEATCRPAKEGGRSR